MRRLLGKILILALVLTVLLPCMNCIPAYAATNGISERLENLRSKFPEGKHWNHLRTQAGDDGDTLKKNQNNSYSDCVSDYGCATHNAAGNIGQYDCNAFDGAIQCYGFANKVFYEVFGQYCSQLPQRSDVQNVSIGDHVRFNSWGNNGHSAIVLDRNGNTLTIVEANFDIHLDKTHLCMIHWDRKVSLSDVVGFYHATNWDEIYNTNTASLDVNSTLDDVYAGNAEGFGTFDVYIDGSMVADDVSDYYARHNIGSTYTISDIKALGEHTYEGDSTYSGTIDAAGTNIQLPFYSYGSLEAALSLNGAATTEPAGSFDLYINGALTSSNISGHTKSYPRGTTYKIENIKAADGSDYSYSGASGSLSGTIDANTTSAVTLNFVSDAELTGEWQEFSYLPGNATPENCEIQYKHTYTQDATTAPGADWVQGSLVNTVYENSGGVYDSDFELSTSDTRVYVGSYYYHYCGANTGIRVEHYQTSQYTDYHYAGDVKYFNVTGEYTDDDDSRYHSYVINWVSGEWAGQRANCIAGRSSIYYRRYQYQDRVAVNTYTWIKQDTDWVTTRDDAASSVTYRIRLKDEAQPTIDSVKVTGVSTTGYTIACAVSDDSSVAKVYFETWTDVEGQANAVVQEIVPDAMMKNWEGNYTVSISDHGNMRDCDYHTTVRVVDGAGNEVSYSGEETTAYIPTLFSSAKRLTMPAGLKAIEASAFEGDMGIGEVVLPEGTKTIGSKAFADCARLVKIQIPDSVTEIATDAFENSGNVVLICASNNAAAQLARENGWHYVTQP